MIKILRSSFVWKIVCAASLIFFLGGGLGLYFWLLADLPSISKVESRLVRPTSQILDRHGRLLYEVMDPDAGKQIDLRLDALPAACIQATLATEDSRFYEHPGVDLIAIARASWQNWRSGEVVSGASTLTQQLARILLLPPQERYEQSLRRKLREAWLAWRLESRYTKNQLLALYINQSYYGNFAFGLEAAAQNFFAKPAAQLSPGECTLLAGLTQYPTGYNPLQVPEVAKARQLTVLRLMQEAGYLSSLESERIAQEPLHYRSRLFDIQAPHFVVYVEDLLARQLGVERLRAGGLRVTTSLDLDLQRQAEDAVRYRLDLLNCRTPGLCDPTTDPNRRVDNGAAVVLDVTSGQILAMVGSPDYFDPLTQGNVNAALSLRQPGSAIKPLTYAAAMDPTWSNQIGIPPLTTASILADLPTIFEPITHTISDQPPAPNHQPPTTSTQPFPDGPYIPQNYDRRYHGPVSVRTALANSYNIPAVKVLQRIGVQTLQEIAAQAGISSFTGEYGLALTLGGGEVRLLELTAAYGIFPRAGRRLEPAAILRVQNQEGAMEIGSFAPADGLTLGQKQVIQPETAYLLTDILSDSIARIPSFGENSVLNLPFAAAAKTGTTSDWRDNWTVGYSTQRVVGIWVGNTDNAPMQDVSGIDGAGPIWRDIMLAAHPAAPPAFPVPANVVERVICTPSGLLPTPDCPRTRRERFIAGTQPSRPDNQFRAVTVDLATGRLATQETPPPRRQNRVYWVLGPEYREWMQAQGIPQLEDYRLMNDDSIASVSPADHRPEIAKPLLLHSPISRTAYRIHPGVPRDRQRIQVGGYTGDGALWAKLRLMVDGRPIATSAQADHLEAWWPLQAGEHRIWLEGEKVVGGPLDASEPSLVVVTE